MSVIDRLERRYQEAGRVVLARSAARLRKRIGHIQDKEAIAIERLVGSTASDPVDCLHVYLHLFGIEEVVLALERIRATGDYDDLNYEPDFPEDAGLSTL